MEERARQMRRERVVGINYGGSQSSWQDPRRPPGGGRGKWRSRDMTSSPRRGRAAEWSSRPPFSPSVPGEPPFSFREGVPRRR